MKKWNSLSIKTQILVYYLISAIIIVFLLGITLFYSASAIIKEEVSNNTVMAIDNSGRQLKMYIDQLKGLSAILVENTQVKRYFEQSNTTDISKAADKNDIDGFISSILKANLEIASIILIGSDGRVISNEKELDMEFTGDIKEEEWYKAVLAGNMPILTSARMQEFTMDKDTWVISLGREIADDEGNHIGIMRIDLKYDVIELILDNLNLGNRGYPFILNDSEQVVYHKNPDFFMDGDKRIELVKLKQMQLNELSNESLMIHQYNLDNAGWTMVGIISLDSLDRMQRDIVIVLWVIGTIMIITAIGSSNIFANSIAYPLRKLEKIMHEVEDGKFDIEVPFNGSMEIKSLSRHFKSMIDRMKILIEEIKHKEKALNESNLKHLYNQINPHFLYNTMDTIVWLAEFGKTDKVISVSKAMAKFFRLSLHGGSDITTIEDELDHVKQYLFIQQERYDDKLTYEISVDEKIMDIKIPKLLLQPIVENSINHGIRNMDGVGHIKISGVLTKERILLIVEDNGVGFDPAKSIIKTNEKYKGVGLKNVEERVQLYYGREYGLSISSAPSKGAKVTIQLSLTGLNELI